MSLAHRSNHTVVTAACLAGRSHCAALGDDRSAPRRARDHNSRLSHEWTIPAPTAPHCPATPDGVLRSRMRVAWAAVISSGTPPGTSSHSTAWSRHATWFLARPRSRCRRDHTRSTAPWSSAVTGPLTTAEQAEVRQFSTRARITATSFTNEYHWGDFKGSGPADAALLRRASVLCELGHSPGHAPAAAHAPGPGDRRTVLRGWPGAHVDYAPARDPGPDQ